MNHHFFNCQCNEMRCNFCGGGLAFCVTCKGAEGSLPSECPGVAMTEAQQDKVYQGKLDFINGEWVSFDI